MIVNIEPKTHKRIKIAALKRGMTMTKWLESIIIPALMNEEKYD